MYRALLIIFTPIFLWLFLVLLSVDRVTTLSLNPIPGTLIVASWAVITFWLLLQAHLTNQKPIDKMEKLKRDNKPAWILAGMLFATMLSVLFFAAADRLVKTVAQYLPGERRQLSGNVTAVDSYHGGGACHIYVTVATNSVPKPVRTCVSANIGAAIGPTDLEPGQHVTLNLKETLLAPVVLEIRRDR